MSEGKPLTVGRNVFDTILSRDDVHADGADETTERRPPRARSRAAERVDEDPTPAAEPDPQQDEDDESPTVAPSIVRRRGSSSPAVGKVYTCGRCRRKFTDLREYRIHLLRGHS